MISFWFHFDFIWFHWISFDFIWFPLISFDFIWFHWISFDFIWFHWISFWFHFDFILISFWFHFDCILISFWLHFDFILISFWLILRMNLGREGYPHHVQGFRWVDEDAVEYIQHSGSFAGSLRSQAAEEPIESVRLRELGAIRVVAFDYGGCIHHSTVRNH